MTFKSFFSSRPPVLEYSSTAGKLSNDTINSFLIKKVLAKVMNAQRN
jgi:hypothetical protein